MEQPINLREICRLCLNSTSQIPSLMIFEITEDQLEKYEEITQKQLTLSEKHPSNVCTDCIDRLESFYFYKNQLIRKQNELELFLKSSKIENEEDFEMIEEYLVTEETISEDFNEEIETVGIEEVLEENLQEDETYDEDLEIDNELEKDFKKSTQVPRVEEIKYQKLVPKMVLTPNFLKAREALKNHQNVAHENVTLTDYTTATLINNNEDKNTIYICNDTKCKAEFTSEKEMKLHLQDHNFPTTPQKCEICPLTFKMRINYEKHMTSVHGENVNVCQVCGKVFESRNHLRSHLRNHDTTLKYPCRFEGCSKAFRVKHHLDNHIRAHNKESPFECNFEGCKARFRQKHALTIHIRKHTGNYFFCEFCKSPFVTVYRMNKHLVKCDGKYKPLVTRNTPNVKHDSERLEMFKCSFVNCGDSFKAKISLEKHLKKIHNVEVTSTMCIICCQDYENLQLLKSHMRDHLPFTCSLCSINFKTEENLNNHVAKSHNKDENRQHRCIKCPASFKRAEHLKTHVAYKHENNRPFACDLCPFSSPFCNDLNSHMKTHMRTKDFACRICGFKSKTLTTIKTHMKSQHGTEDYYSCSKCSQGFRYQLELNTHQKEGCS